MIRTNKNGFTLIEILIVISVIGALAGITYSVAVPKWRERTYYTRSVAELGTIASAMKLYVAKYNDFPPDTSRALPSGLSEFVQGDQGEKWPDAPFPGSVYDWENWPADEYGDQTYQVSIRFCEAGQDAICKERAKKYLDGRTTQAVLDNWTSESSMYYCIKGACRPSQTNPANYSGFCINCADSKSQIY